ncbi:DNA integrity scanning protein DisA nucleotide-binding domain protein [Methanocella sp. MCL-LM]|uniref:DNA integrity scanning protein DisA nucleotide-binding domain protein n=1 Tax=Methanocella sp. MCL-LM TaxID=3412035 RepID=UPI003C72EC86
MELRDEVAKAGEELAEKIGATAIIIISPEGRRIRQSLKTRLPVIIARVDGESTSMGDISVDLYTRMPADVDRESVFLKVSRIELMSEAIEAAYIQGLIEDKIVLGIVSIGDVHSVVVVDITDIPFIKKIADLAAIVDYTIIKAVLNLAIEIGREGREGKSVGTAFVVGDTDNVLGRSHQLILNPYEGHPKEARDIRDENNWETVKEFAQLDGMFIVDERGYLQAAGRYIDASARGVEMLPGMGGRHLAAAAITRYTKSVAVTVSGSGGMITVYQGGHEVFKLNPRISIT